MPTPTTTYALPARLALAFVLAATGLTMAPRGARADEPPAATPAGEQRARELYEQGNTHYDLAEYDQAIALFKEAYTLSRRPTLLYNIAQSYRLKGDCELALQFYKNYLRLAPDAKNKDKVDERIAEMETCTKDPSRQRPVPKEALETKGQEGTGGGDVVPPTGGGGELKQPPPGPVEPAGRGGGTKKMIGLVTAGVGVVLVGTGVFFSLDAKDKSDVLVDLCNPAMPCTWSQGLEDLQADGAAAERNATIFYVAGGAAVVGGAVLYVLGASEAKRGTTVSLLPHPRGGVVAAASFRF